VHPVEVGEALGELLEEGEVGEELAEAEGVEGLEGVESLVLEVVPGLLLNRIVTLGYLSLAVVKKICWSLKI